MSRAKQTRGFALAAAGASALYAGAGGGSSATAVPLVAAPISVRLGGSS